MPFRNQYRTVGTIGYTANGVKSLDMPRKHLYRYLLLEIEGSLNIGTLGSPVLYTGGAHGAAFRTITRVELIANGRDTIKSISLQAAAMKALFMKGVRCQFANPDITGTGAKTFGGVVPIYILSPRAVRQIDTLLDSGRLSTLELRITFNDENAMFSTLPTAYTVFDIDVKVALAEAIRLDARAEAYMTYKEHYNEKQISGATTTFQMLQGVGNHYRGFMIETESDGEMVDTILNKVTLKSGTDTYFQWEEDQIRGDNISERLGNAETLTGYYYIDFVPEGRLVDKLDASILSQLEFELDVNNPGTLDYVRIYPDELIMPAPGAQGVGRGA